MKIDKAVQRIGWRFSQGKEFRANNNDIEAFNSIVDYIQNVRKGILANQKCFAKLYIFLFGELIKKYETTVFDPTPQKELNKILDKDLNYLIHEFTDILNDCERYMFIKDAGIEGFGEKHPVMVIPIKKEDDLKKITAQLKKEGRERFSAKVWSIEEISDNLISMVNKAIEVFSKKN